MKLAVAASVLAASVLTPPCLFAAEGLGLGVDAGIGGVAKAGRWCPVRISIDNTGQSLDGEIVVTWGDSVVHRRVVVPAPSRQRFDMEIRTNDARPEVHVQLIAGGVEVRSINVPLRTLPPDSETTLCVTSTVADESTCEAETPPSRLPRSMRGYDAVERVVWRESESGLTAEQRSALEAWRAYRRLAEAGALAAPPRAMAPASGAPTEPSLALGTVGMLVYACALGAMGVAVHRFRWRPLPFYAMVVATTTCGAAAAGLAGRAGPSSAVQVRYASTLQQLAAGRSLISARGHLAFPAFDTYQVRAVIADAELAPASRSGSRAWLDEGGYPVVAGTHGLAASQAFALDGVAPLAPLEIERRANHIRVTNASDVELQACQFSAGVAPRDLGVLGPGRSAEGIASDTSDGADLTVSCLLARPPIEFVDPRYEVRVDGTAMLRASVPGRTTGEAPQ
ncbi:MAG: hypothetical protein ABUS56_06695 [Acidobacteriota bacterium]